MQPLTPAEIHFEFSQYQSISTPQRPAPVQYKDGPLPQVPHTPTQAQLIPTKPSRPPLRRTMPPSPPQSLLEWADSASGIAPLAPRKTEYHRRARLPDARQARQPSPPILRPSSLGAEEQRGLCLAAARLKLRCAQKMLNEVLMDGYLLGGNAFEAVADATVALQHAEQSLKPAKVTPLGPDESDGLVFQFTVRAKSPVL